MTPEQVLADFRSKADGLPGAAPVAAAREAAIARFAALGYPSRTLEDWRYTDLAPIVTGEFELFPSASPPPADVDSELILRRAGIARDALALVFVDGARVVDCAAQRLGGGIELLTLEDSLDRFGPACEVSELETRPLAAINVALATHGARLRVEAGAELDRCLHVVFACNSPAQLALQPQLAIELGANSRASIAIYFLGDAASAGWTNLLTKVQLASGSNLTIYRVQDHGPEQLHTELLDATIGADAHLRLTSIDFGGRLVRNDTHVRLSAAGGSCDLAGLALAAERQHIDNHVAVEHLASHTISEQNFRCIAGAKGRGVFNGKVVVHKGTRGISANQASDNLLLADTGEIDTKPELEIHADDVKCSHGATVGELDRTQLFYLRARGISDATAQGLLTLGFANTILERAALPRLSDRVASKFGLNLPEDPNWRPTT